MTRLGLVRWRGGRGFADDGTRSVSRGRLSGRVKSFEKCDKRGGFRGAEIFAVGGHVAAALNYLANELVFGLNQRDVIERWSAFSAFVTERMTIVALLELEDERALTFERRAMLQKFRRDGVATPGIHHRTPGSVASKIREGAKRDGDKQNDENGDRASVPTFFAFAKDKRKQKKRKNADDRANKQRRRFHFRRKQREERIQPQEEIIRTRRGLDDRGIGPAGRAEGTEVCGHEREREKNAAAEEDIFLNGARHERECRPFA